MVKCSKCSADNEADAKFCEECGAKISKEKTPKKLQNLKNILLVVFGIVIIGLIIFLLVGKPQKIEQKPIEVEQEEEKTTEEPTLFQPEKCVLEPGLACVSWKIQPTQITLVLENGLGKVIQIDSISIGSCSKPFYISMGSGEKMFTLNDCNNGVPGEVFEGDITLKYTELQVPLLSRTVYGNMVAKIEPRAKEEDIVALPSQETTEIDLSNYPNFFIENNIFRGVIVVGDKAPAEHVIAASDIAVSLQSAVTKSVTVSGGEGVTVQRVDVGSTKLASEVPTIEDVNAILIGTACDNTHISKILNDPADCTFGLEHGKGKIDLYKDKYSKAHLVVSGYPGDIRNAAQVLANYGDYNLKGTSIEIIKVNNQLLTVWVE